MSTQWSTVQFGIGRFDSGDTAKALGEGDPSTDSYASINVVASDRRSSGLTHSCHRTWLDDQGCPCLAVRHPWHEVFDLSTDLVERKAIIVVLGDPPD